MNIREIEQLKIDTESQILKLLKGFEEKSTLYVTGLEIKRLEYVGKRSELMNCEVNVSFKP